MYLPDSIARRVSALPYEESGVGMSGSKVLCYENMVLKIVTDMADYERSRNILGFLEGKLPAPRIIEVAEENGTNYLLMTRIRGKMACAKEYIDAARMTPNPAHTARTASAGRRSFITGSLQTSRPNSAYFRTAIFACRMCS